jgi:alpha-tubulin suppressor-like RCC1 family protein
VAVSMGAHACALKLSGELFCWGQGEHGQLGYAAPKECFPTGEAGGTTWGCSGFAQAVVCAAGPCRFTDVSTGMRHTCAIDTNQDAWCWGDNYDGALGTDDFDPTNIGSPVPRRVVGGLKFLSIHAAFGATCGLTTSHNVYCWGRNSLSVIPALNSGWANDPRLVSTPEVIDSLDYAQTHACGRVANGNLYCWGSNAGGELGAVNYAVTTQCSSCPAVPQLMQSRIPALMNQQASLFTTGAYGSCAHLANGTTPCWGWLTPVYPAGSSLDRLSRGYKHYCTISRGNMKCAGSAALGDGSDWHNDPGVGPVQVSSPPTHFRELDAGSNATCAIGYDENVYCWGSNSYGRLGLGIGGFVTKPTALGFPLILKFPPKYFPWKS